MTHKLRVAAQQAMEALENLDGTEFQEQTKAIKALRAALAESSSVSDWLSYDQYSDVLTIHGRRYSAGVFDERGFGLPPGTLLRIVDGPADVVTLEQVAEQSAEHVEPVAWMWQHDETGRTGFVDSWQLANGWQQQNPRLHIVSPLYTAPQPAKREPLTREQAMKIVEANPDAMTAVRMTEAAHGITGETK